MLGVPAGAGNRNRSCSADRSVHGRSVWVVPRSLLHSARLLGRARLGRRAIARARRAGGVPHADGRGPAASVAWLCCWRGLTCLRYIFSWHVQFRITVTVLIVRLSSQRGDSAAAMPVLTSKQIFFEQCIVLVRLLPSRPLFFLCRRGTPRRRLRVVESDESGKGTDSCT